MPQNRNLVGAPPQPPPRHRIVVPAPRPRRGRRVAPRFVVGLTVIGLLAAAVAVGVKLLATNPLAAPSYGCHVAVGSASYPLDSEQTANATTIGAVGKRMGMPDHAVTIALAAALQESRLHNLTSGDLDSLGIFQQRPSQGWGTPAQIMTPSYAATAFYQHLSFVRGWPSLPVTVAAQRVQRSGAPDAYADWELEARALAEAVTGEVPAGVRCLLAAPTHGAATAALQPAIDRELGAPALGVPLGAARGWTVSAWVVGHAAQYGITAVTFAGRRWTAATGRWDAQAALDTRVQVVRGSAAASG